MSTIDEVQADHWFGRGRALTAQERFDEAEQCFRQSLQFKPRWGKALWQIAQNGGCTPADIEDMRGILADPAESDIEKVSAGFGLAKHLDAAGGHAEAFQHFSEANALYKIERGYPPYDVEQVRRDVDHVISTYTPQFFAENRGKGYPSHAPIVYICGFVKMGGLMVEQILTSNPDVFSGNELNYYYHKLRSGQPVCEIGNERLEWMKGLGQGAGLIINKKLRNILSLGAAAVTFPKARVIFCRRDARDACLSSYFNLFGGTNALWSYDLADCAAYFSETERLMAHWRSVLPLEMLEVDWDEVVSDFEGQRERLFEFVGAQPGLGLHRTLRGVLSLSNWGKRKHVYAHSIGRWRNYEAELEANAPQLYRETAGRNYF